MKILITGACGWTAQAIAEKLTMSNHEVIGLDLPKKINSETNPQYFSKLIEGSILDRTLLLEICENIDALYHLAITVGQDEYQNPRIPFEVNVFGTYSVLETARLINIPQIILMSEAAVHLTPTKTKMKALTDWSSDPGTGHLYDLTKRLQEEIARDFVDTFKLNITTLRAGHIVDGRTHTDSHGRSLNDLDYCRGGWVCRYDLANACQAVLEHPQTGYRAYHIIGARPARKYFDVEQAELELGLAYQQDFREYE